MTFNDAIFIRNLEVICSGRNVRLVSVSLTSLFADVAVCGRELRRPTGEIVSPNYPLRYPASSNCEWTIVLPTGRQILLHIQDFMLETSQNCSNDYLEIRCG